MSMSAFPPPGLPPTARSTARHCLVPYKRTLLLCVPIKAVSAWRICPCSKQDLPINIYCSPWNCRQLRSFALDVPNLLNGFFVLIVLAEGCPCHKQRATCIPVQLTFVETETC